MFQNQCNGNPSQLQDMADAAALAGAKQLDGQPGAITRYLQQGKDDAFAPYH